MSVLLLRLFSPVYTIQPVVKPVVRFGNRLYRVYKHSTDCQTRLTTGLSTGCIVYTAGCQTGCTTRFDSRLNEQYNRIDNRLYRVNGVFNIPADCRRFISHGPKRRNLIAPSRRCELGVTFLLTSVWNNVTLRRRL